MGCLCCFYALLNYSDNRHRRRPDPDLVRSTVRDPTRFRSRLAQASPRTVPPSAIVTADRQVDQGAYVAERHEIAARYKEWEITGPPDVRDVDPEARYCTPWKVVPHAVLMRMEGARRQRSRTLSSRQRVDEREAFLAMLFLRRYGTYCARRRRHSLLQGCGQPAQRPRPNPASAQRATARSSKAGNAVSPHRRLAGGAGFNAPAQ